MRRLLLSLTLLFLCGVQAEPTDMIWVSPDNQGRTHKNISSMGIKEATLTLLADALPELKMTLMAANNIRALQMLEDNQAACAGNKILSKDRAARFYATALPQTVFPGLRLYTRKDSPVAEQLQALAHDGTITLAQTLNTVSEKQFGVVGGRRYSDKIDEILLDPVWQQKEWTRTASDMGAGMMDMLLKGRIAALLEHPNSAFHYQQQLNSKIELQSFTLAEAPDKALGYILCSHTEQGKKLSLLFSQTIARLSQTRAYLKAHLDWLPMQDKAAYLRLYNDVYGTAFEPSEVRFNGYQ